MGRIKGSKNKPKDIQQLKEIISKKKEQPIIEEPVKKQPKPEKIMRSGWVNIQSADKKHNHFAMTQGTQGFYTGGDIYETEEIAKAMASKNTVAQTFVRWYC